MDSSQVTPGGSGVTALRVLLPRGGSLPEDVWRSRHRGILVLLWLHVPLVFAIATVQGLSVVHATLETGLVVVLAALAHWSQPFRRLSTTVAAVGLLTCSGILVHLADGLIEMHFHYFVMVGVVTLYQDWRPFLVAIAYVVVHHAVGGFIDPESVYNHQAAIERPALWAVVHGTFILGMSASGIVTWKLNEGLLDRAIGREQHLAAAQEELLGTLSLLNATLESTTDGILVVDLDGRIRSHNRNFAEMWSIPDAILDARDDAAAIDFVLAQLVDPEAFTSKVTALYARPTAESEDTLEFRDGRVIERYSQPQLVDGEVVGRVWSFRDVTEGVRLAEELAHRALHDSLTDIANQALFRDRVDHALALARQRSSSLSVLLIDLDDFKRVNDSLGHSAGDRLLVAVSERIQRCLRSVDTLARFGGDEFAVLIEDSSGRGEAERTAERVLAALREAFDIDDREVVIGASIGIAVARPETDTDQLLRNADLAMYKAKDQGRNRVATYSDDMHLAAVDRLTVEAQLRRAIDEGELVVHYQPLVSLRTGRMTGVEALVRWQHPTEGLLAPGRFIEVAESSGLIVPLGRQVLEVTCAQAQAWRDTFPDREPLHASVNVSARQLHDCDVAEDIAGVLARSGLPAELLTIEITESAMVQDVDSSLTRLHATKDLGVHLAIDDFGTGYSSLSYLQRFPADIVKVDQSFVQRIGEGVEESALARAIVRMAHTLQLSTVAEGVETDEQLELLVRLGCHVAQGFWFSPAVDADAITEMLVEDRRFAMPGDRAAAH